MKFVAALLLAVASVFVATAQPSETQAAWGCGTWKIETTDANGKPLYFWKAACDHLDACENMRLRVVFERWDNGARVVRYGDWAYQSNEISTVAYRPAVLKNISRSVKTPCVV